MTRKRQDQSLPGADIFELPDWIPQPVAHLACLIYKDLINHGAAAECTELLHRLTCDPRMEGVWAELLKRKRSNYQTTTEFFHSASSGLQAFWDPEARLQRRRAALMRSLGEPKAEIKFLETSALLAEFAGTKWLFPWYEGRPEIPRQQLALAFLFRQTFTLAQQNHRPVSRTEAEAARNHYVTMAKRILADNTEYLDERLSRAASAYLELADVAAPGPGSPLLVERKRGRNKLIKGFVLELAATTKEIFGASLFGTVATLTNVALDRADLTAAQVRQMVASHTLSLTDGLEVF
jgi:hypothetical protein